MAVMLRGAVSTSFGRHACGLARSSRVIYGTDHPSRLPKSNVSFQEPAFVKKNCNYIITASFADREGTGRCGSAVVALVNPITTRQGVGVLERPIELDSRPAPESRRASTTTIDQSVVPLPRSFLAESVSGNLVECSGRGSRPLYTNVLAEFQFTYTSMMSPSMIIDQASIPIRPDQAIDSVPNHSAVKRAFQAALETAPDDPRLLSEYATFTWRSLNDVNAAEEFYTRALELAPHDPAIQASHALFLWHCED